MQIPFTSFNFSALAKDILLIFPNTVQWGISAGLRARARHVGPEISPGCYVLALVFERLSPSLAGAAPVEPGPVGRADRDRGRRERFRAG